MSDMTAPGAVTALSATWRRVSVVTRRRVPPAMRRQAMFAFLCVVWGTTWLGMKVGIAVVPPGLFAGMRWTCAGLALLAWRVSQGHRPFLPRRLILRMVLVSLLLISFSQVIQLYGLRNITAGLAAVISSALTPIALLGFSAALGQERFTWRQAAAIAVGVVGIVVLFGPKAFTGELRLAEVAGAGGVVVATLLYSFGSVQIRPMMRTVAPSDMAWMTNLIGGGLLLVGALLFEPGAWAAMRLDWGMPAWIAWLYLLIPGSLLSTVMYFLLVRDWGASRVGTYAFVSPVIAVVVGAMFFGEHVEFADVVGMGLMLAAAGIVLRRT
jgi:drug/metabolite transporter (DMT)-like permease